MARKVSEKIIMEAMKYNLKEHRILSLITITFVGLVLTGCGIFQKMPIVEIENALPPDSLKVSIGVEASNMRVDLFRKVNFEEDEDGEIEEEPEIYHPLGFFLGDALFLDLHGNLSLSVTKLLNISPASDFVIEESHSALFSTQKTIIITRNDNKLTRKSGKRNSLIRSVEYNDSLITIHNKNLIFSNDTKIIISPNGAEYNVPMRKNIKVEQTEMGYKVRSLLSNSRCEKIDSNRIKTDLGIDIERAADRLIIVSDEHIGKLNLYKVDTGYILSSKYSIEKEIVVEPGRVSLYQMGEEVIRFEIL